MDLAKKFGTDQKKEIEGSWFDIGQGARLLIARAGNRRYNEYLNKQIKPVRRQVRAGSLEDEAWDAIVDKCIAETILLGWEGIEENGVAVQYSKDAALRFLTNYPDFRNMVLEIAQEIENYRVFDQEEAEKN